MLNRRVAHILAALAALCALSSVVVGAVGREQTRGTPMPPVAAKAKLAEATAAAKKWRADAILIQVASKFVNENGMTAMWDYAFWSTSAKTCAIVNVGPTQAGVTQETGGVGCEEAEVKDFIDSDQALKIARSNGITAARVSMVVSTSPVKGAARAVWVVMDEGGMKPGNVMLDIDATTGAVVGKTKQ
jgi:hypothetical protein